MMCQDKPEDSEEYTFELQDGDIIVSATDGIFDNLFSHEILQIVKTFKNKNKKVQTKKDAEVSVIYSYIYFMLLMCLNRNSQRFWSMKLSIKSRIKRRRLLIRESTKRLIMQHGR
jgi:serine/threonine protein phosphatase PrpC